MFSVFSRDKLSGDIALDIVNVNETEAIHLLLPLMHYNILLSVHNHYSPLSPEQDKNSETRNYWNSIFEADNNGTDFILGDSFIFPPWFYSSNILCPFYICARGLGTVSKISEMPALPGLGTGGGVLRFRHQSVVWAERGLDPPYLRHVDPGAWPVSSVRSKGQCQDRSELIRETPGRKHFTTLIRLCNFMGSDI